MHVLPYDDTQGSDPSLAALPSGGANAFALPPLRILMLEDVETDAELIQAELRRAGIRFGARRVENESGFVAALETFHPDIVLADFSLPQFSALEALAVLKREARSIPFVLVTGTQTEEIAVDCIRQGADDYILKDSMTRLPSAVANAIRNHATEEARKRALEALRQSEERYRLITENTRDLVCLLDAQGLPVYVSPASRELLGIEPLDLCRQSDVLRLQADGKQYGLDVLHWTLASLSLTEVYCRHADGGWRTFEASGRWICDADGRRQCAVLVLRDVTARRRAEDDLRQANVELAVRQQELMRAVSFLEESHKQLQTAHLQLIQAEKLESVGRLAAGIAHEVKNPLTVIMMGVEYLQRQGAAGSADVTRLLQDMETSARKANQVIHELLSFAMPGPLQRTPASINAAIESALGFVRHEFASGQVRVERDLATTPALSMDSNKIEQVFVNLFLNAVQAMPAGGTLTVRSRLGADHGGGAGPARIIVEVQDSGCGADAATLGQMLEPFFTTKMQGSGLGLTIVQKIVELHGGTIQFSTPDAGGLCARVSFPVDDAASASGLRTVGR
jgi:PAS domain S-box-containing protein